MKRSSSERVRDQVREEFVIADGGGSWLHHLDDTRPSIVFLFLHVATGALAVYFGTQVPVTSSH